MLSDWLPTCQDDATAGMLHLKGKSGELLPPILKEGHLNPAKEGRTAPTRKAVLNLLILLVLTMDVALRWLRKCCKA